MQSIQQGDFAFASALPSAAADPLWDNIIGRIDQHIQEWGVHPARVVVLVPYAQLMGIAQRHWARLHPNGFAPNFETTRNWAQKLDAAEPQPLDLFFDVARDTLTARSLLDSAGLAAVSDSLAQMLLDAAYDLSTAVAAVPPQDRSAWLESARAAIPSTDEKSVLRYEALVAKIAVEWAGASRHSTDVLFNEDLQQSVGALVILEGFVPDPLQHAVLKGWEDRSLVLPLWGAHRLKEPLGAVALHAATDAEDEAHRAAACVIDHVNAGRTPVMLISNDRALTRRIRAHLDTAGVVSRDESGWALSTTHAGAQLIAGLKACAYNASTDEVLAWIKFAPGVVSSDLGNLERVVRRFAMQRWSQVAGKDWSEMPQVGEVVATIEGWRAYLKEVRPLAKWLVDLRRQMEATGQWEPMVQDVAGERVLSSLRMLDGQQAEIDYWVYADRKISLVDFVRWVKEVLEASRFLPPAGHESPVSIAPLSQILARPFAAVVIPGCDEKRLVAAPDAPGAWTQAQRAVLGLTNRDQLEAAQRAAWAHAVRVPHVDVLWRTGDEGGEPLLASPLVLALELSELVGRGADKRVERQVTLAPTGEPAAVGKDLPLEVISASSYTDLRHCPYRFFGLRQLGLKEENELTGDLGKRDFGTWLHAVLQRFHESLRDAPVATDQGRIALLDACSFAVTKEQGFDEGDFLPFAAGWPQVRDGYLTWLRGHEADGAMFVEAEKQLSRTLDGLNLVGCADRVDSISGKGETQALIVDYKTEDASKTLRRVESGAEDIQLAFYAAMSEQESPRAAYINVGERGETRTFEQEDVLEVRDLLIQGLRSDFTRIYAGEPLKALGEGAVCDYCAVRGLCRKDFWK